MKIQKQLARVGALAAAFALLAPAQSASGVEKPLTVPALKASEIDAQLTKLKAGLKTEAETPASSTTRRASALRTFSGKALITRGLGNNRSLSDAQAERIADELSALKKEFPKQEAALDKEIYKAKSLTIGRQAPEIEGVDVDGVSFKLSDYRGKVVVIDFWGDW